MCGIVGIRRLDGAPIDPELISPGSASASIELRQRSMTAASLCAGTMIEITGARSYGAGVKFTGLMTEITP